MLTSDLRRRLGVPITAAAIVLLFAAYAAWRVLAQGLAPAGGGPDELGMVAGLALAGTTCLLAGRSPQLARRQSHGWRLIGAAWLLSALGLSMWVVAQRWGWTTLESVSNVAFSSYYLLAIPGLALLAALGPGRLRRLRAVVESAVIIAAVVTFDWYLVLRFHGTDMGVWQWMLETGIVVAGEFVLVLQAALLLHRPRALGSHHAAQVLALGTLTAAIADLIYEQADMGSSAGAQLGADLGLALAAALVAGAGLLQLTWRRDGAEGTVSATGPVAFDVVTMVALALVAGITLLELGTAGHPGTPLGGLAIAALVIGALLGLRVVLTRRELHAEAVLRGIREEALHRTQQMESLGRLAAAVAHDFNNVLAVVLGSAELLRQTLPTPLGQEELNDVERAAQSGAALSRQLLALSRPAPEGELVVDLHAEALRLRMVLARLLPRGIALDVTGASGVAMVTANPSRLEQALLNLTLNARDAISGSGHITISTEALTVGGGTAWHRRGVPEGRYALLAVRDDGVGMPPDVVAHAFEPFFTTKGGRGNGLGLATVHAVVSAIGGHAQVDSAPGRGTTISLLIPLAAATAAPRHSPSPTAAESAMGATGRGMILLVDDERAVRRTFRRLLERGGYAVQEAGDGEEALRVLESCDWQVDLVLTDILMPVLRGDALARRIRVLRPDLPVLCISGHLDSGVDAPGEPWSGDRLITKPCTSEVLLARVAAALAPSGA